MESDKIKELAEKTTHDISNRKINLSLEEKISRTKEFARMIKKFEEKRDAKCLSVLFELILLPEYIKITTKRLSVMFKWLFLNWKKYAKSFPEIPDFEQARKETSENILVDTWDKGYVNKEYNPNDISKAFSVAKKNLPPKPKSKIRKHSQVELMRRMRAEGKIYSVIQGKWIEKGGVTGQIVDPGVELKKVDSKLNEMEV